MERWHVSLMDMKKQPASQRRICLIWRPLLFDVLLLLLLVMAAVLRMTGLNWDEGQHLHPDERFLTSVETSLESVDTLKEYWDTEHSSLNPHNRGYGFFVYGTLPIFLVRYAAEWAGWTGYNEITLVGRMLSAIADLGVVLLVYRIATRLYDRRVGLLAAAFSAFTVMQIQLSHFFATDTFLNLFSLLAVYFAVKVTTEGEGDQPFRVSTFVCFGAALGLAVASKLSAAPVAAVLPLAVFARWMKLDPEERSAQFWTALGYLVAAAFASLIVFRICQPYAFSGPGFFGIKLNQKWVDNIASQQAQARGDVDWPPSIQWARRPLWFSLKNVVLWGMGLPFAMVAWSGFLWLGWRMIKGEWKQHIVLWGWTAAYFSWQSLAFNPTMRYQLLSYPGMAVFAAWVIVSLWDLARRNGISINPLVVRSGAVLAGMLSLGLTAVWALMFTSIYTRPVTRVAATEWIYHNLPGPLTLVIVSEDGTYQQPLSFPYGLEIRPDVPFRSSFAANAAGTVTEVQLKHVLQSPQRRTLVMTILEAGTAENELANLTAEVEFTAGADGTEQQVRFIPQTTATFVPEKEYLLKLSPLPGAGLLTLEYLEIHLLSVEEESTILLNVAPLLISAESPHISRFSVDQVTTITDAQARFSFTSDPIPEKQKMRLLIGKTPEGQEPLATAQLELDLHAGSSQDQVFVLDQPLHVDEGQLYYYWLENLTEAGSITLLGTAITVEAPWDDGLPLRTQYDGYGGIYQSGLSLDMYLDDNPQKLAAFLDVLDRTEYIAISSSRQWASTTRIPERYPLNLAYYRNLLGCPQDKDIEWCYEVAQVGMFKGQLGFELVQVFQSDPSLGSFSINDQPSEEAFTVYDHPKVFIFRKTADYDSGQVAGILGAVDFDHVVRLTPKQASRYKGASGARDLMLPAERFEQQQKSGTWSQLFERDSKINRSGFTAFVVWYFILALLGLVTYPILRLLLPNLDDHGYPLARTAGLLILSYTCWMGGSLGVAFSQSNILWICIGLTMIGIGAAWVQRRDLINELKNKRSYFLKMEAFFLVFFLLSLFVRLGNPDLWHPAKGGEKPMDFSYFNAVLKSDFFPPYDPWFAGGYINYYYYGYVYVGTLVKLLGIVPSTAYNLIIPTMFASLSSGAFSLGWNLFTGLKEKAGETVVSAWWVGSAAALGTAFIGNLGSMRMILRGFQRIAAADLYNENAFFLSKWWWSVKGFFMMFAGKQMPYIMGDWYWLPSRVIPAPNDVEPITEFPWFTYIYADLHAHMISLSIVTLVLAWMLSLALGGFGRKGQNRLWDVVLGLLFGGLAIGALRPTNTWDLPTYLALALVALLLAVFRHFPLPDSWLHRFIPRWAIKLVVAAIFGAVLVALSFLLYQPYGQWYVQGYTKLGIWNGTHTPTSAYLTHWGLFLFVLVCWMAWETRQWMASTPASSLRKLKGHLGLLIILVVLMIAVMVWLHIIIGARIYWLVLPLGLWAAILLLRPDQPDAKKIVLFTTGTGLFLTLMVEVIVLSGDIGRMNTVFKFYLQAWVLFALSAAVAGGWLLRELRQWCLGWKLLWHVGLTTLVFSALLFPIMGTAGKIQDRMAPEAPHTLDGMDYMRYAVYHDQGTVFELAQDHQAILWMQENVAGTPVIVEGHNPEYRWGTRFAIYTGLPTVLGWRWHQIQQRIGSIPGVVEQRADEIEEFYITTDISAVQDFLDKYGVEYIILGQLERAYYPGEGLEKFEALEGELWQAVYRQADTVIYQVIK